MQAAAWTVIGILGAAVFGLAALFFAGYQHVGSRIDALGAELRSAIQEQGRELRSAIEAQGARLESRLDHHIETRP